MNETLELFHYWRSSCSWRVRWALHHKGIAFKKSPVNLLNQEQRTSAFIKLNPLGAVPCLKIGNEVLTESLAIIEYLEQRFPQQPLIPSSPLDAAHVRQLALTVVAATQPLQNLNVLQFYSDSEEERAEWARHWIAKGLRGFAALARQWGPLHSYSFGSQLTLADLCLIPQIYNAKRFAVDLSEVSDLVAVYDHCMQLESCIVASPDRAND